METIEDSKLDEMEQYCIVRFQKRTFIKNNSFISYKQLQKLRVIKSETSLIFVSDCFEKMPSNLKAKYFVEMLCPVCGGLHEKTLTKTDILEVINDKKTFTCDKCKEAALERSRKQNEEHEAQLRIEKQARTKGFLGFINPNAAWIDDIPEKKRYLKLLNESFAIDEDFIANAIKSMPYRDFLMTPYWKAIAYKKKQQAGFRCELCNSRGVLHVHHRTYERHGYELSNLKDLIVLCDDCHKKFHDIEK